MLSKHALGFYPNGHTSKCPALVFVIRAHYYVCKEKLHVNPSSAWWITSEILLLVQEYNSLCQLPSCFVAQSEAACMYTAPDLELMTTEWGQGIEEALLWTVCVQSRASSCFDGQAENVRNTCIHWVILTGRPYNMKF